MNVDLCFVFHILAQFNHVFSARGTKRKTPPAPDDSEPSSSSLSFSSKTVQELALKAEEAAMKQIELEQAAALKHKLPDFWLPSLTPTHAATAPQSLADVDAGVKKLQTSCRGAAESHPVAFVCFAFSLTSRLEYACLLFFYRLKTLIPVKFSMYTLSTGTSDGSSKEDAETMCPSCKKRLSNNLILSSMHPLLFHP
jgi:nitric oxide synthase-interacting protein